MFPWPILIANHWLFGRRTITTGKTMVKSNLYDVLGVSKNATKSDIKESYIRMSKVLHPDINPSPNAATKFQAIAEAYSVLSDAKKRRNYDQVIAVNQRPVIREQKKKRTWPVSQTDLDIEENAFRAKFRPKDPKHKHYDDFSISSSFSADENSYKEVRDPRFERFQVWFCWLCDRIVSIIRQSKSRSCLGIFSLLAVVVAVDQLFLENQHDNVPAKK